MSVCFNPRGGHAVGPLARTATVCPEPGCGFLLKGALLEHWQTAHFLQRGPTADLYLATDTRGGRSNYAQFLVKVLRAPLERTQQSAESLLSRIRSLEHTHIHPITSLGWLSPAGALYVLTPFEELGSLQHQTAGRQPLPPLAVAGFIHQLAEALQYAHEHQVVHGRLRPSNCLIATRSVLQVCDFYQSLFAQQGFSDQSPYTAPEQAQSPPEPTSDQFALAVIAYQLLTGRLPISTPPVPGQRTPAGAAAYPGELGPQGALVLGRAMSANPPERFPSMLAFAAALYRAVNGETPLTSRRYSPREEPTPPPSPASSPTHTQVRTPLSLPHEATPLCLLPGHTAQPTVLKWSPGGDYLASAGADQQVRLWWIQKDIGTPLTELPGHTGPVLALSWSPDGSLLASAGADATLRLWDLSHFTQLTRGARSSGRSKAPAGWWGHDGAVQALEWSPDGSSIASGGVDRVIRLWDPEGNLLTPWQAHGRGGVSALAWSPDGTVLASGGADHQLILWDPPRKARVLVCDGHTDEIRHLAWSADGRWIASVAGKRDVRVCVWDARNGQRLAAIRHPCEVLGAFWSSDSTWLATASADGQLRFWSTDKDPGTPLGQTAELLLVALSFARVPQSGLVAFGLNNLMIQVLCFTTSDPPRLMAGT